VREGLSRVARELGIADPDLFAAATREWPGVVGDAVAAHARLRHLREGVLTVDVDDGAWASQLRYLEADVLRRLAVVGITVERMRVAVVPDRRA
jgi:predicted nucleic acid-binding Zn ribbon protein